MYIYTYTHHTLCEHICINQSKDARRAAFANSIRVYE